MTALQLQSGLGLLALCLLAWALGGFRRGVSWRVVLAGLGLQPLIAALLLHVPALRAAFAVFGDGVNALAEATKAGTSLGFGYLGGAALPFDEKTPGASFILFFQALPLVLVVGALTASLVSAPAAVLVALLMRPETAAAPAAEPEAPRLHDSAMEAITRGALDGLNLLLGIMAMRRYREARPAQPGERHHRVLHDGRGGGDADAAIASLPPPLLRGLAALPRGRRLVGVGAPRSATRGARRHDRLLRTTRTRRRPPLQPRHARRRSHANGHQE